MTPDALARLEAPLHHLVPHGLFLCFRQLGQRRVLADLVELAVVDGHGFECFDASGQQWGPSSTADVC